MGSCLKFLITILMLIFSGILLSCTLISSEEKDPITSFVFSPFSISNETTNVVTVDIKNLGFRKNSSNSEIFHFTSEMLLMKAGEAHYYEVCLTVDSYISNGVKETFDEIIFGGCIILVVSNADGTTKNCVISGFPKWVTNLGENGIYGICYNKYNREAKEIEKFALYSDLFPNKVFKDIDVYLPTARNMNFWIVVIVNYDEIELTVYTYEDLLRTGNPPRVEFKITNTFRTNINW